MICLKLSRVLKKNSFLEVVPTQSVQRSCSMDNESNDGEMVGADDGATTGIETLTEDASRTASKMTAVLSKRVERAMSPRWLISGLA